MVPCIVKKILLQTKYIYLADEDEQLPGLTQPAVNEAEVPAAQDPVRHHRQLLHPRHQLGVVLQPQEPVSGGHWLLKKNNLFCLNL